MENQVAQQFNIEPTSTKRISSEPSAPGPSTSATAKKPKFSGKSKQKPRQDGKRTIAKFEKRSESTSLFTYPISVFFLLHTEFTGASLLAHTLYNILHARDNKMTQLFTVREFQYVTLLSAYYRTAYVVNSTHTAIIHGMSYLKDSVSTLLLPDIICQYLEILGIVRINDISMVPYFGTYRQMREMPSFIDAYDYLTREQKDSCHGEWPVNDEVIMKVQNGLSRALKGVLELRTPKKEVEGSEALLASYTDLDDDRIQPRSPFRLETSVCSLGACFRFRSSDSLTDIGLRLPSVHEAPPVLPMTYLDLWVMKQLKG